MTRADIITQVGRLTGRTDDSYEATIAGFLNQSIREYARERPWIGLRQLWKTFATGRPYIILPQWVQRPLSVFDVSNVNPVEAGALWDFEQASAYASRVSGLAIEWRDMGTVPTVTEPSGNVTVASGDSSDTEAIRITGFAHISEASGTALESKVVHESLTLTGTSPVSSTYSYTQLLSISKTNDTSGDVSVRDAASGTLLTTLGAYDDETRHLRIELLRVPTAGTEFRIAVMRRPLELEDDAQAPEPGISEDYLIWHTAGLSLISLGERQAGVTYVQKAQAIVEKEHFRDRNFGDTPLQMIPITATREAEERMVDD